MDEISFRSIEVLSGECDISGRPVYASGSCGSHTVDIDEKMLAEAYYIRKDGETIYNVYNLLGGKDDWDPLGNGEVIRFARKNRYSYTASAGVRGF